jgi:penicillin-binding protein 2
VPQQAVQRPAPTPGLNLRLTIDKATQAAAEAALRRGIRLASSNGANAGALVAIDVKTGEILAMASAPSFDPNWFISPQRRRFQPSLRWVAKSPLTPSFDRAIAGTYPAGSTFKPFVAFAAAAQGLMSPYTPLLCTGSVTYDGQQWRNFDRYIHQWIALPEALTQSCDTYFYQLGYEIYKLPPRAGHPIQDWARKFGFGTVPGVDLSGAAKGRLPTPAWKRSFFTDAWSREWRSGDSVNLAIGQGDLLVTPLQMVQAYAAIANGGTVVTPHLANDVETATGDVKRKFVFPTRQLNLPAGVLPAIQTGLEGVTHAKTGTASALFAKFPIDVAGKTGTAQKPPQPDYSWFVSYAPANDPKIAVAVIIERGGHGGTAAAPTALDFYQRYFHTRQQPIAPIADQSG